MIRYLAIRNLAVIESVAVDFEQSFNILTGETGAGKSILVEAVGLLLGGRATQRPDQHRRRHRHGRGDFRNGRGRRADRPPRDHLARPQPRLHQRRAGHGRGAEGSVEPPGRAARPARTSAAARSLATSLAARYVGRPRCGARPGRRRPLLRSADFASSSIACAWTIASARRGSTSSSSSSASCRRRTSRPVKTRRCRPIGSCCAAPTRFSGSAPKAMPSCTTPNRRRSAALGRVWKKVGELAAIDPRFAPYLEARDGIKAQLEDLAFTLRDFADGIDASPARLQQVEDRLALLERLKRKHGGTLEEAIARRDRLAAEHAALTGGQSTLAEIEDQLRERRRARSSMRPGNFRPARRQAVGTLFEDDRNRARRAGDGADQVRGPAVDGRVRGSLVRRRHRRRRVLPVAECRRGPAAARPNRLGRRAVACHAGAEDPRREWRNQTPRVGTNLQVCQDPDLRRGRRRHRRAGGQRGGGEAGGAGRSVPGALHHAPAADRGVRTHALPDREARAGPAAP